MKTFCQACGKANEYQLSKPSQCKFCNQSFLTSSVPIKPATTAPKPSAPPRTLQNQPANPFSKPSTPPITGPASRKPGTPVTRAVPPRRLPGNVTPVQDIASVNMVMPEDETEEFNESAGEVNIDPSEVSPDGFDMDISHVVKRTTNLQTLLTTPGGGPVRDKAPKASKKKVLEEFAREAGAIRPNSRSHTYQKPS